ncbi:hypothetical protein [Vitiosangium sp. GDMCC 1.1324]|uniref:hypothetical protein n=1 Tax=Vitiosangium sp. (strain GDMCC 1.1324) TaxID=2138576 RepID=UPI000D389532|nr:hypothetical protein [Vitiosangium sp. GDMCC 1.1324]PTL85940.1 hypothetical protein DAT35_00090 [Vitiosangium sp. GDMCC 1.1324]
MKLLVLPPHRDVTCVPDAPEGWRVLDVARAFCQRVMVPETLARAVETREREPATPESMRELLLLRAALVLWKRGRADAYRPLRALGAVLTALSGPPAGVRVRLDDIELEGGTTERSADVQRSIGRPALFNEDLVRAADRFPGAERVRLWLEKDLQLPAAVALAAACPASVALEVAGPFATTHRAVLATLPAFQRASFPEDVAPLRWRVSALDAEGPEPLTWVPEGAHPPADGGPWAGHVSLSALRDPEALVASGCRTAVVGFCSVDEGSVLGSDGTRVLLDSLAASVERLRSAGVRVVAEWWVGAPGVDEATHERTFVLLGQRPVFDWVSGVRQFHWTRGRSGEDFAGVPVRFLAPPEDRDLSRTVPFEAPGTVPQARLPELLNGLAGKLLQRAPLSPGRVAWASLHPPSPVTPGGDWVRLDGDCALVQLPAGLDGVVKPSWYAANLRTGGVLAMDARLAPMVARAEQPVTVGELFATLPEAQRGKVEAALVGRAILERVHA